MTLENKILIEKTLEQWMRSRTGNQKILHNSCSRWNLELCLHEQWVLLHLYIDLETESLLDRTRQLPPGYAFLISWMSEVISAQSYLLAPTENCFYMSYALLEQR